MEQCSILSPGLIVYDFLPEKWVNLKVIVSFMFVAF